MPARTNDQSPFGEGDLNQELIDQMLNGGDVGAAESDPWSDGALQAEIAAARAAAGVMTEAPETSPFAAPTPIAAARADLPHAGASVSPPTAVHPVQFMPLRPELPVQARVGLGIFTALVLLPVVAKDGLPTGVEGSWATLAGEAAVRALSGFAATLAYTAIAFGASLLDLQAGFSMASVYDQTFGSQGALLERFYSAIAALLFFLTDAHHLVIQSLVQLFVVVPLGAFSLSKINPDLLANIAAGSFVVAIELVFPVMVALLLADVALAVLARVAPQFGIFQIGLQLKVCIALLVLIVTMPLLMPRLHQLFAGMVGISVAVLK